MEIDSRSLEESFASSWASSSIPSTERFICFEARDKAVESQRETHEANKRGSAVYEQTIKNLRADKDSLQTKYTEAEQGRKSAIDFRLESEARSAESKAELEKRLTQELETVRQEKDALQQEFDDYRQRNEAGRVKGPCRNII